LVTGGKIMKSLPEEFGINVKRYRKQQKFSQEKLAEKCDLSRNIINQIENGKSNATLLTISLLAEHLKVHPAKLFETD
jgi:transcriptional regulator with XRE-family HTH domain